MRVRAAHALAHSYYFRLIWFSFSFLFSIVSLHSLVIHNDTFVRCGGIGRSGKEGKWIESYVGQEARQTWSARFGLWLWHPRFRRWLFGRRSWIASRPWRFAFELIEFARTSWWFWWCAWSAWLWTWRTLFGRSCWYSEYGYIGERCSTTVSSCQACSSHPREARTSPCWRSTTLSRYPIRLLFTQTSYDLIILFMFCATFANRIFFTDFYFLSFAVVKHVPYPVHVKEYVKGMDLKETFLLSFYSFKFNYIISNLCSFTNLVPVHVPHPVEVIKKVNSILL